MKRNILKAALQFLLCTLLTIPAISQTLNWNVNLIKPKTFVSLNPYDDPNVTEDQMWKVSVRQLMKDPGNMVYGIIADLNDPVRGNAKVSVYLYNDTAKEASGRGPLIYECVLDKSNNVPGVISGGPKKYELGNWLAWWPDAAEDQGPFHFNDEWNSTDHHSAILTATEFNYNNQFLNFGSKFGVSPAVLPVGETSDTWLPVIIEITVFKANVKEMNLPGIGIIEPGYFKPPYLDITATPSTSGYSGTSFALTINNPQSLDEVSFSDINIKLNKFGELDSLPLASEKITRAEIPYSNNIHFRFPPASGEYVLWANYDINVKDRFGRIHTYPNRQQFLFNYSANYNDISFQRAYEIDTVMYYGLPVYKLSGGMSAEYGVEKSLASLSSGISETWDARKVNGVPDIVDGGPVSVYPDPNKFDFLQQSINQTVAAYDKYLGSDTYFETVIIGTGVAHVPYLCNAMKAPFLPIHFLVSTHSVAEVKRILDTASSQGLSAYSTVGNDPSIKDIGVSWIKLRNLPKAYADFLNRHKVKNVILMGYFQGVQEGESEARRIWIEGQDTTDFAEGSLYMMGHGDLKTYKDHYKDYYRYNFGEEQWTADWEGGLTDVQVEIFSDALNRNGNSVYTIRGDGSGNFYRWGLDIQLYLLDKMNKKPVTYSMNEYLIGYPEYELWKSTVPYLYWQGLDSSQIAFTAYNFGGFKMKSVVPPSDFKNLPVYIQAKANRTPLLNELKKLFTNVTMDKWQKADVWDPADGMTSPCELAARDIALNVGGAKAFAEWNKTRATINFDDLQKIMAASVKPPPLSYVDFPKPLSSSVVKSIPDAGMELVTDDYSKEEYWHPLNYPNNIELRLISPNQYPGKTLGFLDGQDPTNDIRRQSISIATFDLSNNSDEYDLRLKYKFNITDKDGLTSYDPALGEEQNMNCFEFTSVPYNHWFDIPSRVMAREGAVLILNGGVYDFDYNGIPGVVPFIKKNGTIKAQPQILSYKGEGAFAWNWGTGKKVSIMSRPKDIPGTGLAGSMSTLFQSQTSGFQNAMGGMTFMTKDKPYDITALQPDWMKNYPPFPLHYLTEGQRCFFAPLSNGCIGTEIVAPVGYGWNDCNVLNNDNDIQRFSTLAYRQYPKIFDDVPNARTFVGIRTTPNNQQMLDIGIINGDYGQKGWRGRVATKSIGMHNYEVSQFCQSRGYTAMVNLDGGSSTQMWLNGRGPLQMLKSYILHKDNQGPYYSRLLSSFIMLVPKLHTELIRQKVATANPYQVPVFDNTAINFNYSDSVDTQKDKAFIDLSPCKDSLNKPDGNYGLIAGNFSTSAVKNKTKHGGVLFYAGEDMYYPDTKGLDTVFPRLRNLLVAGVGLVPPYLVDSLIKMPAKGDPEIFRLQLISKDLSAYYIKVYNGTITDYILTRDVLKGPGKYLSGDHRFYIKSTGDQPFSANGQNIGFFIDGVDISTLPNSKSYFSGLNTGFLNIGECTHAHIGAINIDGRFITGDIAMRNYNYLFAVGRDAWNRVAANIGQIDAALANNTLPDFGNSYFSNGIYALQCLENSGQHVFALAPTGKNRFYGLRLNNEVFFKKSLGKKPGGTQNTKPKKQ